MRERDLIDILRLEGNREKCGIDRGRGERGDRDQETKYLLYEFLNLISESIFALRRNGEVDFLLGDGFDIVVQVNKVCGGLKVDFAMVGVHCFLVCCKGFMGYGDEGPLLFTLFFPIQIPPKLKHSMASIEERILFVLLKLVPPALFCGFGLLVTVY